MFAKNVPNGNKAEIGFSQEEMAKRKQLPKPPPKKITKNMYVFDNILVRFIQAKVENKK
jgi:hypothetical protein